MTPAESRITIDHLKWLKEEAARANSSYAKALRRYKRQQKSATKTELQTELIRLYLDKVENENEGN